MADQTTSNATSAATSAPTATPSFIDQHLIDDWRQSWKKFSVLVFAMIAVLPEFYQLAQATGLLDIQEVPQQFRWIVRAIALLGIYARLVRQKDLPDSMPSVVAGGGAYGGSYGNMGGATGVNRIDRADDDTEQKPL